MRLILTILLFSIAPALLAQQALLAPTATEIVANACTMDDASSDTATDQIAYMSADVAQRVGELILKMESRGAIRLLGMLEVTDNRNALVSGVIALSSQLPEVRGAAILALTNALPTQLNGKARKYLTKNRLKVLQEALTSPEGLTPVCLDFYGAQNKSPYFAMSVMMIVDHFFGADGFYDTCYGLSELMLGAPKIAEGPEEPKKDGDNDKTGKSAEAKKPEIPEDQALYETRRAAVALLEVILLAPPAQEFGYDANADYQDRQKAVDKLRKWLGGLRNKTFQVTGQEHQFTGVRYGDYLLKELPTDFSRQGYILLMYMSEGQIEIKPEGAITEKEAQMIQNADIPLDGEDYAKLFKEYSNVRVRVRRQLNKEIAEWWYGYRSTTG